MILIGYGRGFTIRDFKRAEDAPPTKVIGPRLLYNG